MTTHNITHEIDLATLLDGISLEVDFTVELHERTADDEGSVEITVRLPQTTAAETAHAERVLGKSIREEIIRLINDGTELTKAARAAVDGG